MLLWLSAKSQGSWSQFRSAVEELNGQQVELEPEGEDNDSASTGSDLPIYQQFRFALQRLGHVEFFSAGAETGWRVVPPTIAIRTRGTADGVLCGARSPALLESLCADNDLTVNVTQIDGMPQRIAIRSPSHELLVRRAREHSFRIQNDAPMSLLLALPGVRDSSSWRASKMPETPGWLVHRFSTYNAQWEEMRQEDTHKARSGLFRFTFKHQRFYYLRSRGCTYSIPVQVGKYAVMPRRKGTLTYDPKRRTLSICQ
jgi:hypothetical protein